MTTLPAISIITPTYNRRETLLRAIASVRAQTFDDYEHIVVDDGSTDGTADIVADMQDSRLRYVRFDERRGANAARNHGIGLAKSNLVTFLDSDDEFLPLRLERSVALFAAQPGIDLSISSFEVCKDGRTKTPTVNRSARFSPRTLERAVTAQVTAIAGTAITVRKPAIEEAGLFDEGLWRLQDRDLLLRLAAAGYGAAIVEGIDWIKHHSHDSISRQRSGYVTAYGELLGRHAAVRDLYPDIATYMVARRLLNNILQGRISEFVSDYRANSSHEMLGFSVGKLVFGYLAGRKLRRQIVREVRNLPGPEMVGDRLQSPAMSRL